jgi:hypothetical protein
MIKMKIEKEDTKTYIMISFGLNHLRLKVKIKHRHSSLNNSDLTHVINGLFQDKSNKKKNKTMIKITNK